LRDRDFFREVWESPEFPNTEDEKKLVEAETRLGAMLAARCEASKSWYKIGTSDLLVSEEPAGNTKPLSLSSTIVGNMKAGRTTRLYVRKEDREAANTALGDL
jgi:hypothetical protein